MLGSKLDAVVLSPVAADISPSSSARFSLSVCPHKDGVTGAASIAARGAGTRSVEAFTAGAAVASAARSRQEARNAKVSNKNKPRFRV